MGSPSRSRLKSQSTSGCPNRAPHYPAITSNGRIISVSSCSRMWQCYTYRPGNPSNFAMILVTMPGSARIVSFQPDSSALGGIALYFIFRRSSKLPYQSCGDRESESAPGEDGSGVNRAVVFTNSQISVEFNTGFSATGMLQCALFNNIVIGGCFGSPPSTPSSLCVS